MPYNLGGWGGLILVRGKRERLPYNLLPGGEVLTLRTAIDLRANNHLAVHA
jgi:hypothetical protein